MDLQSRLRQDKPLLDTLGCTKREESLGFGAFMWTRVDSDEWADRIRHHRDPGVRFTDEPHELGGLPSVEEGLAYAVAFLVDELNPREISVQRVYSSRHPKT